MIKRHFNKHIAVNDVDAILYCSPLDIPEEYRVELYKQYPQMENDRQALFNKKDNQGEPVWVPGKILLKDYGHPAKILHGCGSAAHDGNIAFSSVRLLFEKIRDNYQRLEIGSLIIPLVGSQKGEFNEVIESFCSMYFDESTDKYNPETSLMIHMFTYSW